MGRLRVVGIGAVVVLSAAATMRDPLAFVADDSWFYLVIGRNIADGHGITFSRAMPTNGFQPLWQAIVAAVVGLVDRLGVHSPEGQARAVLAVAATILAVALAALDRLLRRLDVPAAGRTLALLMVAVLLGGVLGTSASEANLTLFFVVASVSAVVAVVERPGRSLLLPAGCGALLGLMVLARLDTGFVALAALGALVAAGGGPVGVRLRSAVAAGSTAAFVVGPYLLWNRARFGHVLPIAGAIKLDRRELLVNPQAVGSLGWVLLAGGLALAGGAWWGRRPSRVEALAFAVPFLGAVVSTAIYLAWAPGRFTDLDWYKMPHLVAVAVAGGLSWRRLSVRAPRLLGTAAPVVAALVVAVAAVVVVDRRLYGANHRFWHPVAAFSRQVGREVPATGTVATLDFPGVLAMYSDRRVVGLDGLTGDFAFQDDLRDRGAGCALRGRGVRYLVVDDSDRLRPVGPTAADGYTVVVTSWLHHVDAGDVRLRPRDRLYRDPAADLSLWRIHPTCPG